MASVSTDDVRNVLKISSSDIPDAQVLMMIKRTEATLELELNAEIDYANCTDAQKEFISPCSSLRHLLLDWRISCWLKLQHRRSEHNVGFGQKPKRRHTPI